MQGILTNIIPNTTYIKNVYEYSLDNNEITVNKNSFYSYDDFNFTLTTEDILISLNINDILYVKTPIIDNNQINTKYIVDSTRISKKITTPLSLTRYRIMCANIGDWAIFAGGYNGASRSRYDAYNSNLVFSSYDNNTNQLLQEVKYTGAAGSNDKYAIFAGGYSGSVALASVDAVDKNLLPTKCTNLPSVKFRNACSGNKEYVVVLGGTSNSSTYESVATVAVYSTGLIRTTLPNTKQARSWSTVATLDNKAFFIGGSNNSGATVQFNTISIYDENLVINEAPILPQVKGLADASIINNYIVIGGGIAGSNNTSTVYSIDTSFVVRAIPNLSQARQWLSCATVNKKRLIFAGGMTTVPVNTVDTYNENLEKMDSIGNLSQARLNMGKASIGEHALFAGGYNNGSVYYDVVDVYTYKTIPNINISTGTYYSKDNVEYIEAIENITVSLEENDTLYVKYKHEQEIIL